MGCSDSKATQISNGQAGKKMPSKTVTSSPNSGTVTIKEFFDTTLALPTSHGEPYVQPELPSLYVEQTLSFENENVDSGIWETRIDIDKKSKITQDRNSKKGANNLEITWQYRKPPNRKYTEPMDSVTIEMEYEPTAKKRSVVVVSNLYLGSQAASSHNVLDKVDVESTHSLVVLGNLFDMLSIDSFHHTPTDNSEIEKILANSEPTLSTIRSLAEQMNVYYMLGSHDTDLTRVAMERLLGDNVTYIQQTNLILSIKIGNESYRVRLTPGHQWDFLNNRKLATDRLLVSKPIGHYLSRAATNNPTFSPSALMKPIVIAIPTELSKDFLQQISKRPLQEKITERMLMCAFQLSKPEELIHFKCLVDEGKYISVQSILEYPYIKYLLDQYGEESLMSMLKAMVGDYSSAASEFGEDVLIAGLGDEPTLSKVPTTSGQDIICASTGSCSRRSDKMTMLNILYPKQGSNGKIEIVSCESKTNGAATTKKANIASAKDDKMDTLSVESL